MGNADAVGENGSGRTCVCCGIPTASRGIPACWEHWIALPEDLRSSIVISQGRGKLSVYAEALLEAVQVWRLNGAWRPKAKKAPMPAAAAIAEAHSEPTADRGIISLFHRRQKSASPPASHPAAAFG